MDDEAIVLEKIRDIRRKKSEEHRSPLLVTYVELVRLLPINTERARAALNNLYMKGKIMVGSTLNDKYILLIE